jgi:hypothetical protein
MLNNIPAGKKSLVKSNNKIENHEELVIKEDYNRKKLMKNINK